MNSSEDNCVLVVSIDHMREHSAYKRHLSNWVGDLSIDESILLRPKGLHKHLTIFLRGASSALKQFMKYLRTVSVDVDTQGRACKERMSTVVMEMKLSETPIVATIDTKDDKNDSEYEYMKYNAKKPSKKSVGNFLNSNRTLILDESAVLGNWIVQNGQSVELSSRIGQLLDCEIPSEKVVDELIQKLMS